MTLASETRAPDGRERAVKPVRLQLSRKKGFDLQAHSRSVNGLPAVVVSRPGPWGNPWSISGAREAGYTGTDERIAAWCCDLFREWLSDDPRSITRMLDNGKGNERAAALRARLTDLRGRNLACWCAPGSPCHADVLLELANGPVCEALDAFPASTLASAHGAHVSEK